MNMYPLDFPKLCFLFQVIRQVGLVLLFSLFPSCLNVLASTFMVILEWWFSYSIFVSLLSIFYLFILFSNYRFLFSVLNKNFFRKKFFIAKVLFLRLLSDWSSWTIRWTIVYHFTKNSGMLSVFKWSSSANSGKTHLVVTSGKYMQIDAVVTRHKKAKRVNLLDRTDDNKHGSS